jgi:hypothetical protein
MDGGAIRLGEEGATKIENPPLDEAGMDPWRVSPAALPDGRAGTAGVPCGVCPSFFPHPVPEAIRQKARRRADVAALLPYPSEMRSDGIRKSLSRT